MGRLASYLNSAPFLRLFHAVATVAWAVMIPVAVLTELKSSIPFLVAISLWALVASHWSSWQSARVEVKTDDLTVNAETADVHADKVVTN